MKCDAKRAALLAQNAETGSVSWVSREQDLVHESHCRIKLRGGDRRSYMFPTGETVARWRRHKAGVWEQRSLMSSRTSCYTSSFQINGTGTLSGASAVHFGATSACSNSSCNDFRMPRKNHFQQRLFGDGQFMHLQRNFSASSMLKQCNVPGLHIRTHVRREISC